MTRQALIKILLLFVLPILSFGVGWHAHGKYHHYRIEIEAQNIKHSDFKYTSPLIDYELPDGYTVRHEPIPFRQKIKKFVDHQIQTGKVLDMSVYYRDLSDGPWFGINEQVRYNPASMMKVPLMIGWLKRVENDPSILQQKFTFDAKTCPRMPQTIEPRETLKDGVSYTVEELLHDMLSFSDNKAMWLLHNGLSYEEYNYVLDNMEVTNYTSDGNDSVTVHGYSGFYRVLYNASFLSKEMSEKALQLLSLPDFADGIVAGIPKGVKVASKFGEWQDHKDAEVKQLHEFGIVYHPKGPYIIGIMTRGTDFAIQADLIRQVSEMIYGEVNVVRPVSKR